MATTNLFKNATVVEAKGTKGKKTAKATTEVEGLELYAAIDHSIKWLKTLLETTKTTVIEVATHKFVADGVKIGGKPANFDGEEGKAVANIQLKKRSSASGLNDIELALCNEYNVPTEQVSDRPVTYIFNPAHLAWIEANGMKLSAALAKIPGAPGDLIQKQEATTKIITTDDSLDFVFRTLAKKPDVIAQLLPVVGTLAIKPKYEASEIASSNDSNALETIKTLIEGEAQR